MKRKLLPIMFVSIAVFFTSCGNSFYEKQNKKTADKAFVSFSAILNSEPELAENSVPARAAINPVNVESESIEKIELKIFTVENGEEIPYIYDDSKEEGKNIIVFESQKNDGDEGGSESFVYAMKAFEEARIEFPLGNVYSFYVNLFTKEEKDGLEKYTCVQSGKNTQVELQAGENEIPFETKYVESGQVVFEFFWNIPEGQENTEFFEDRVASVKVGLFTGHDFENLTEVEKFKLSSLEIQYDKEEDQVIPNWYYVDYNVNDVPNGDYQLCVELYGKKQELLNRFYYPLSVYGYKSTGWANIRDFTRHYYIEYSFDEDVKIISGKEDRFVNYVTQNSVIWLPDASCLEKDGYNFSGWYTSPTFEDETLVKKIDALALAENEQLKDITVYAKWALKQDTSTSTTGTILFEDESIGYTITMTIDEPFTLNSGSASFDIVLSDGTDLVDSGKLANPESQSDEGAFPFFYPVLFYGDKDINKFAKDDDNPFYNFMPSIAKEPAEIQEGESLYTKPKLFLNPDVPLEVSGMYRVQVVLATSPQNLIYEFFDIPVENKINYEEDVTASNGNISENLKKILKNRQGAEITVKLTGTGTDYIRGPNNNAESATICQLGAALWDTGILKNNNVNLDLSELKGVTNVPEGVFYYSIQYSGDFSKDFSSLILPEGITDIGDEAFKNCTSLKSLTIPTSVESMAPDAFLGCSNLTNLKVSEGSEYYEVRKKENAEGTNLILVEKASEYNFGETLLWQYFPADAENLVLDYSDELYSGIKVIGPYAYSNNKQIQEITSFGDVECIESHAYYGAENLSKINLNGVKIIDEEAFWNLADGCEINSTKCSLQGINKKVFSNIHSWDGSTNSDNYVYNINFSDSADYYVLDFSALEESDNWDLDEYVKGVLAKTDYSAVFNAAEPPTWSLKLEDVQAEFVSVDYNDPRHSRYGWGPSDGDEDPPLDEEVLVEPNSELFKREYFNTTKYQLIVPLVRNDPNDPNND